jgi:negative regulator of replication initiation
MVNISSLLWFKLTDSLLNRSSFKIVYIMLGLQFPSDLLFMDTKQFKRSTNLYLVLFSIDQYATSNAIESISSIKRIDFPYK